MNALMTKVREAYGLPVDPAAKDEAKKDAGQQNKQETLEEASAHDDKEHCR